MKLNSKIKNKIKTKIKNSGHFQTGVFLCTIQCLRRRILETVTKKTFISKYLISVSLIVKH